MSTESTEDTTTPASSEEQLEQMQGAFVNSLKRNNKKIRSDRAVQIAEQAEIIFKREVEDLSQEIKQMRREREMMLDMSPTTADSLVVASDFNAKAFVQKYLQLGVDIRNKQIKLDIAKADYKHLFEGQ